MTMNPEDDFLKVDRSDPKLTSLVRAVMEAEGSAKDRKTHLTMEQALYIARARAFADSFVVEEWDEEKEEYVQIEGPLELIHMICDYLENTAVSISGKGMKQLENILTAQMRAQDERSELERTVGRVAR